MQKSTQKLLILVSILLFLAVAGAGGFVVLKKLSSYMPLAPVTNTGASPAVAGVFTLDELSKHSSPSDCYVAYQNTVFNITWYIPKHEGGEIITQQCGQVVDDFSKIHPGGPFTKRAAQLVLQASKVGILEQTEK